VGERSDFEGSENENIIDVYLSSVVTILIDGEWYPASAAPKMLGEPLFMISAWNPGVQLSEAENEKLSRELEALLNDRGYLWVQAKGADPNSDYFEPSYVITNIAESDALSIARDFKQVAIFRITHDQLTVIMCDSGVEKSLTFSS
jgi:hypothetical protein